MKAGWNKVSGFLDGYFKSCLPDWQRGKDFDPVLLKIALASLVTGLVVWLTAGYHGLFFPLQTLARTILPQAFWENVTFVGDTITALTIGLIFCHRYPQLARALFFAAIIGTLLIHGLKWILDTPRPPAVLDENLMSVFGPAYKTESLPSGHTATAFILAGLLTRCISSNSLKYLVLLAAALVGWSRVACGVHWPVDVFSGATLGLCSAWLGLKLADRRVVSTLFYLVVSVLLLTSSVMLIGYNADFDSTLPLAYILSIGGLFFWLLSWTVEFTLGLYSAALTRRISEPD